jgi:hypothetical protein
MIFEVRLQFLIFLSVMLEPFLMSNLPTITIGNKTIMKKKEDLSEMYLISQVHTKTLNIKSLNFTNIKNITGSITKTIF